MFRYIPAVVAGVLVSVAAPAVSEAALAVALTDNQNGVLLFDTSAPEDLLNASTVHDAANNAVQDLIGIDFRPLTGVMYGVGRGGAIYTIDTSNTASFGTAVQVGTMFANPADDSPGNPAYTGLLGSRFGFDFNPVADRLRIISDVEQNLRVDVTTGATTTDANLAYAGADVNAGQNPSAVGAAYTNSFAGADSTTLFDIDVRLAGDRLVTQAPPNAGTLNTVGTLGENFSALLGFDILLEGRGNIGYAAAQEVDGGVSRLYEINLGTGAATEIGVIGGGDLLDGLTVIPEPAALSVLAIGVGMIFRRR